MSVASQSEENDLALRVTGDISEYLLLERAFCQCAEREDGMCVCGWDDA